MTRSGVVRNVGMGVLPCGAKSLARPAVDLLGGSVLVWGVRRRNCESRGGNRRRTTDDRGITAPGGADRGTAEGARGDHQHRRILDRPADLGGAPGDRRRFFLFHRWRARFYAAVARPSAISYPPR